jgi:hypothetical protein
LKPWKKRNRPSNHTILLQKGERMTSIKSGHADRNLAFVFVVILLIAIVVGCQTSGARVDGRTVTEGYKTPILPGGPHPGSFITRDMKVTFQYQVEAGKLDIYGTSELKYTNVTKLSMTLYYLDDNGTVIDYYRFFARPRQIKFGKVMDNTFRREFDIPAEAKAFSIGYTGKTRLNADGGGWVFQYSPF